jgi:hypothetical protein
MNISDSLNDFIDQPVNERGHGTSSEYVREFIIGAARAHYAWGGGGALWTFPGSGVPASDALGGGGLTRSVRCEEGSLI